ncbi:MAG: HD-GYP domain-containing protein, partial [Lachnospiraceae bacterium]|nr:HD-GYP domain-containing protein [Lachnospiraceae bacterium]
GVLNEVKLTPGNNAWFEILFRNLPVNIIAFIVLVMGLILLVLSIIMQRSVVRPALVFYLSLLMIDMAVWVFSESAIRQIIFRRPSLSQYFSYTAVELIGVLACLYFDEVQHRVYHKKYIIAEALSIALLLVNLILHFTGIKELYETLPFAHILEAGCLLLAIANIIQDIKQNRVRAYKATVIGMLGLLIAGALELAGFYVSRFHVFGVYLCTGLVIMMAATLAQTLLDQIEAAKERESRQNQMMVNTIETIAGAIDAKDEYTGGHSERVGHYAAVLARGMAADYNFTEEDIERIHYIGIMHDIGKIGVADTVLNKAGKLTDAEYALMKKHVEIGSELMTGLDEGVKDLRNGIRYHHERFDGKGYPEGLSETEIPLVARIICLADCYDAMTSNRVYRKRLSDEEVRAEIVRCAGTQFDPALAEIFVRLMDDGDIYPLTEDGMASSEECVIPKSALLENYLQQTALTGTEPLKNPSQTRMLCYVMKLLEKKKEGSDVLIIKLEASGEPEASVKQHITAHLHPQDLAIEFLENTYIIALFNRTREEVKEFTSYFESVPEIQIVKQL